LVNQEARAANAAAARLSEGNAGVGIGNVTVNGASVGDEYIDTGLTGRYLSRASLEFGQTSVGGLANEPVVVVVFNETGAELFADITRENTGEQLAIFLDGESISEPVIREVILGGRATISGNFSADE